MATAKNRRSDKLKKILEIVGGILAAILSTFLGINVYQNANDPSTPPQTVSTSDFELEIFTDDNEANDSVINQVDYNLEDVLEVTMIDVGQADCFLLRQGKKTCLIDCGTRATGKDAVEYIKNLGITKLDFVIGTHPHDDHMGGMYDILTNFKVGKVVLLEETLTVLQSNSTSRDSYVLRDIPISEKPSKFCYDEVNDDETNITRGGSASGWIANLMTELGNEKYNISLPHVGTIYSLGKAKMKVIGPIDVSTEDDLNNLSIVMKVSFGDMDIIFTGDSEKKIEKQILERGDDIDAEILKVGHHGSNTSTSEEFLKAISPDYALISAGCGNRYNHPMEETLKLLKKNKIPVYRTDEHSEKNRGSGTVVMVLTENNVSFSTKKGSYLTGPEVEKKYGGK